MKWRLDDGQIEVLDPQVVEALRAMTPARRVAMIFSAKHTMRLRLEGHLGTRHPDWNLAQIHAEIARRMLLGTS
jgi:hypothetical protein